MPRGHTDKKLLIRGLKYMAFVIPLLVLTTYLFTLAFLNKDTKILYIVLPVAIVGMAATIWLGFKGIRTIMRAVFK
ncbi:MAG: hypothetical protein KJO05_11030 [Bacteroidia bacterium]|nr:hypothetical protein [Bacteroidia bacterium]NNF30241.1 hypothetical protein [Flavobacteriaceae bacterium]MBT8277312.1 hypothetical protein [Bacteroidia bacterium]NNJ81625.1 hypothetical protein [Flavobacteriaceae bacterium]NNK54248.1 hypothetical protein [Flavobacteriaceae bacterium]